MKSRFITLLLLAVLNLLFVAGNVPAQEEDVYFINSGQLWRWPAGGTRRQKPHHRIPLPAGLPPIASIAINRRNIAYTVSGLDGNIHRFNGETATPVYTHAGQVRQVALGTSDDILFFSVVNTPQAPNPLADGQIYALDLNTGRAELRFTVQQATVENAWWGAFTIDAKRQNRFYIGTQNGKVYEVSERRPPSLSFHSAGDQIQGLMAWDGAPYLYTTGGAEVYRMRYMDERTTALTIPGARLTGISWVDFPSNEGQPCELTVLASGTARLVEIFSPVVRGPNLKWLSPDLNAHGGRINTGRYRYFVVRGTYWVSMDTRGDIAASPTPRERRVDCTGASATATFSF